jgi:hypothetical protein
VWCKGNCKPPPNTSRADRRAHITPHKSTPTFAHVPVEVMP